MQTCFSSESRNGEGRLGRANQNKEQKKKKKFAKRMQLELMEKSFELRFRPIIHFRKENVPVSNHCLLCYKMHFGHPRSFRPPELRFTVLENF